MAQTTRGREYNLGFPSQTTSLICKNWVGSASLSGSMSYELNDVAARVPMQDHYRAQSRAMKGRSPAHLPNREGSWRCDTYLFRIYVLAYESITSTLSFPIHSANMCDVTNMDARRVLRKRL